MSFMLLSGSRAAKRARKVSIDTYLQGGYNGFCSKRKLTALWVCICPCQTPLQSKGYT